MERLTYMFHCLIYANVRNQRPTACGMWITRNSFRPNCGNVSVPRVWFRSHHELIIVSKRLRLFRGHSMIATSGGRQLLEDVIRASS